MKRSTGTYVVTSAGGEEVRAFVPSPLPPTPSLQRSEPINTVLAEAERKLGALTVALDLLPNPDLFAYSFVRKEAVFSSQIQVAGQCFEILDDIPCLALSRSSIRRWVEEK
jgi:Fic/DOC family N-terminal